MMLKIKELGDDARAATAAPIVIALGLAALFTFFLMDPSRRGVPELPGALPEVQAAVLEETCQDDGCALPLPVVIALTSYRFYTGFLGATWVPFLIAKEGSALVQDRQSLFMGIEKLIYGFSIFLNPIFGLISDRLAVYHPWCGRSSFLLAGVALAAGGIYAAKVASDMDSASGFLMASALWMLGEALADTATEAVVPELLPRSQYDMAGSIRSLQFIGGGLAGYVALIAFQNYHHHWLYMAYMCLMLLCALATVTVMRNQAPVPSVVERSRRGVAAAPLLSLLVEAYVAPMRYIGGFPRACLCMFTFSLGTAPIFFTLLMVRDMVGIPSAKEQQMHFSCISIAFLICAAASSVAAGSSEGSESSVEREADLLADRATYSEATEPSPADGTPSSLESPRPTNQPDLMPSASTSHDHRQSDAGGGRWALMIASMAAFGTMCGILPTVVLPTSMPGRLVALYIISGLLGLSFGGVYARFQTCTWTLLPPGVDIANAMGFAAVMKVTGCGLGNFAAGLILDSYRVGGQSEHVQTAGYVLMCWFCAVAVFSSVALISGIRRQKRVVRIGQRWFCTC